MSRVRALATASLLGLIAAACTENPTDTGRTAPLDIAPSFQVDPSLFPYDPIDHIRLVARNASTSETVGSSNEAVDATADQWALSLGIDLGGESTIEVIVDVELLSQDVVQWSGRVGPITVPTETARAQGVLLYRGSLENLDVESLTIQNGPSRLPVGSTATVSATPTLAAGSNVSPEIFWASSNPEVATVTSTGSTVTLTAVSEGTADIVATAGPASDEFTVEVVLDQSSVTVSPASATIVGLNGTQQFTAAVTDASGNPDPNASVSWSSLNTAVATVDATGLATGVGVGTTQIVATSGGATGQATLTVEASATPGQKLWVGATSSDWQTASNWDPPGVPGTGDDVLIPVNASVTLSADASIASLTMQDFASLDLGGFKLSVSGDLAAPYGITNGLVIVTGVGSILEGLFPDLQIDADRTLSSSLITYGNLLISNSAVDVNGQSVQSSGDLTVENAQVDVDAGWVVVGGNLLVTGDAAQLAMTASGSAIDVTGDVTFDGGDETGLLSEGSIRLEGNFTVTNRSPTGFAASNNLLVYVVGSGATTVSLASPGPSGQRFSDFWIYTTSTVTFSTDAYVTGDVQVYGSMVVPGGVSVTTVGAITLVSGSTFDVDGTVDAQAGCTDQGAYITGTGTQPCGAPTTADRVWVGGDAGGATDWENPNNWSPVGVPSVNESVFIPYRSSQPILTNAEAVGSLKVGASAGVDLGGNSLAVSFDLEVDGVIANGRTIVADASPALYGYFDILEVDAPRTLSGAIYLGGNLDVVAALDLGSTLASISGNLTVQGAGRLIMQNANANLYVSGNATFDGTSTEGSLTEGIIWLYGNLTAGNKISPQSFAPTGTAVYLDGSTDQTVVFSNPGATEQRFDDLYIFGGGGVQTIFQAGAVVTGLLYAQDATLVGTGGGTLEADGTLFLDTTTFDGLLLRLVSSQPPNAHVMSSVTFTNMAATQNQLYIDLPGAGPGSPLVLDSPVFTTQPSGGGNYIEAIGTGGVPLYIQLNNPTPSSNGGLVKLVNTTVTWGP